MARLRAGGFVTALGLFLAVVAIMLYGVFLPEQTLFSNDGPLGQLMAQCHRLPDRFAGCWLDLNSVGFNGGAASPSITFGLQWLLGPVWFSKFYALLSLLILVAGAWCFFRQSKLTPLACLLGGLAAILNSTFFSVACWGVGAHDITVGMCFFALALLADPAARQRWLRVILAGMALGMGVTEGADIGAIFSLYVAAFVLYQTWTVEGPAVKKLAISMGRLALVAVCAAFLAAQAIHGLVTTSISGVKGAQQDAQTKTTRWDWATQWSLPKVEALNLVVPGLFGYRMNTLGGNTYWGNMGRAPAWDTYIANGRQGPPPAGLLRYSGGGNYAGGLVALVAVWAAAQSLRRGKSVFNLPQRKWLWFWLAVGGVSLLLAFGRYAPFYKWIYGLPYVSTIRNPVKFLDLFTFALIVLFAFGVDGLCRRYMPPATERTPSRWGGLQSWWKQAATFEKYWVYGCSLLWLASLLAWWVYSTDRDQLIQYLQTAAINAPADKVADFSIQHAGWFAAVFFLSAGLLIFIFSGFFSGRRAAQGGFCLALLLLGDLCLANRPWVVYWNYPDKYATNPVIDRLRDKPYEHRVAIAPVNLARSLAVFSKVYQTAWMEHLFPYYNIQSFETVEMSRMPEDFATFNSYVVDTNGVNPWFRANRSFQLTATRYVVGPVGFADFVGQEDPLARSKLKPILYFEVIPKPGVSVVRTLDQMTAVLTEKGPFALFEYTAALPRAKLFSRWQVNTNDRAVLAEMFDPSFDPVASVFVAGGVPAVSSETTNSPAGTVEIASYAPKDVAIQADATQPGVLLLNDHFDPNWKVFVDDRPAELLRCNFLFQGVYLAAGSHRVEFKFQPPLKWLYVSLAAVATSLLVLCVFTAFIWKNRPVMATPAPVAPVLTPDIKLNPKPNSRKPTPARRVAKR